MFYCKIFSFLLLFIEIQYLQSSVIAKLNFFIAHALRYHIEPQRMEDLANQIHSIFPTWALWLIFHRGKTNPDKQDCGTGGALYNHYRTYREKLRLAGIIKDSDISVNEISIADDDSTSKLRLET